MAIASPIALTHLVQQQQPASADKGRNNFLVSNTHKIIISTSLGAMF